MEVKFTTEGISVGEKIYANDVNLGTLILPGGIGEASWVVGTNALGIKMALRDKDTLKEVAAILYDHVIELGAKDLLVITTTNQSVGGILPKEDLYYAGFRKREDTEERMYGPGFLYYEKER